MLTLAPRRVRVNAAAVVCRYGRRVPDLALLALGRRLNALAFGFALGRPFLQLLQLFLLARFRRTIALRALLTVIRSEGHWFSFWATRRLQLYAFCLVRTLKLFPANAPPPGSGEGAGVPFVFFPPPQKRGEQSADRRWCGTPHPLARLAVEPISENARRSPASHVGRRAFRRPAAAFSLRRRAALSAVPCTAVSQLLAGDHCVPGRSPDAARVRAVRQHARGRRTGEGPELPGARRRIPGPVLRSRLRPAPPSRRLSSGAPLRAGCGQDKGGFGGGDKLFFGATGRPLASACQPEKHQHCAIEPQHGCVVETADAAAEFVLGHGRELVGHQP
jgi:hypothetical protein